MTYIILILLIFGANVTIHAQINDKKTKPNILLILVDDLGREALKPYGGTSYPTPNIDKIAEKSIRFENVYASPACHPSRLELLSGRYPFQLGYPKWGMFPDSTESETVANELKKAGYKTVIAGKWQLNKLEDDPEKPNRMGFDKYCLFGWHEGPRYWQPRIWQNGKLRDDVKDRYGPDVYSDFLTNFMHKNKSSPMFLLYTMALSHDVSNDLKTPPPYGPGRSRYENFEEMLFKVDEYIGKVVNALKYIQPKRKTLVVITSDNGTNPRSIVKHDKNGKFIREQVVSNFRGQVPEGKSTLTDRETRVPTFIYRSGKFIREHAISDFKNMQIPGGKMTLTDWGVRVPMFIYWTGKNKKDTVCKDLIDFTDFMPTFMELAGVSGPSYEINGNSFAGLLRGEKYNKRKWVYSEWGGHGYLLRTKTWKLTSKGDLFYLPYDKYERYPIQSENDTPESANARNRIKHMLNKLKNR